MNFAIVIPFFGKKPNCFDLFIHSLKDNSVLNIIFYSDIDFSVEEKANFPSNFCYIKFDIETFNRLASDKLGFEVNLQDAGKIPEFKPAYGKIFEDDLKEFDFWGFGDIDLLYGNVKKFFRSEDVHKYDIVSFRQEYISGALTILKNRVEVNTLFLNSKDYIKVFQDVNHFYSFTECNKIWKELKKPGSTVFNISTEIEHFTLLVKKAEIEGLLKVKFQTLIKESIVDNEYLIVKPNEIVSNSGKEFLLYHYVTEKRKFYFSYINNPIPEYFFIDRFGFYKSAHFKHFRVVSKFFRYLYHLPKHLKKFMFKATKKIHRIKFLNL